MSASATIDPKILLGARNGTGVRTIDPDKLYIDYFQAGFTLHKGFQNCFGIRVEEGHCCCAVVKIGNAQPFTYGKRYPLPLKIHALASPLRSTVENHLLNYPGSDLLAILAGKKSFQEAVNSPTQVEPKRVKVRGTS